MAVETPVSTNHALYGFSLYHARYGFSLYHTRYGFSLYHALASLSDATVFSNVDDFLGFVAIPCQLAKKIKAAVDLTTCPEVLLGCFVRRNRATESARLR